MPLYPSFADLALRVLLTLVAGAAIGFERGEHGKAAGLRTTLLVGLAACIAMMQLNLLLPVGGKTADLFSVMDVMRLPLGILSGVGFIGAGAILRRDNRVVGLTTAATLWYVTVLGLCFGGGQLWLGLGGLLGVAIIQGLRRVEPRLRRDRLAMVVVKWDQHRLDRETVEAALAKPPLALVRAGVAFDNEAATAEARLQVRWKTSDADHSIPAAIGALSSRDGVLSLAWNASGPVEE